MKDLRNKISDIRKRSGEDADVSLSIRLVLSIMLLKHSDDLTIRNSRAVLVDVETHKIDCTLLNNRESRRRKSRTELIDD